MQADRSVKLRRWQGDGADYVEPVTGTKLRRVDDWGADLGHRETVWELDSCGEGTAIVRTLTEARGFLAPYVAMLTAAGFS